MLKEFQEFIAKGNVMDLAVGIIIGGAFGLIVSSLVADIVMPIVGMAGSADFSNYFYPLSDAVTATSLEEAKKQGPVFAYGNFVTVVINFLILAFIIFLMVKAVNNMRKRLERDKAAAPAAPPPADVQLLTEIRDLLAKRA
jgi:large conductance mechanosensitive channel